MDPMAILTAGKATVETATDVASKVVDLREKMKDGDAHREMDSRKLEASILYGKWATVFEGVGVATTAAQAISGIVKEQRESKAQAATVYAAIEDKHKQVEAEIEHTRCELELAYRKAEAEMRHQSEVDEQNYQLQLKMHEAKLLELEMQYDAAAKKQDNSHEVEMEKIRREDEREREKIAIERLKAEKEADRIDAEIRQMDAAIETNKLQVQALVNYMNQMLELFMTMITWEMTPENQIRLQQQQTALLQFIPKLQALPMITGG